MKQCKVTQDHPGAVLSSEFLKKQICLYEVRSAHTIILMTGDCEAVVVVELKLLPTRSKETLGSLMQIGECLTCIDLIGRIIVLWEQH